MAERVKLGELLVRAGAIHPGQLEAALREQEKWGLPLGMTLIELKFLDEETLVRTLARQLKVPLAWMRGKRVKPAVIDLVPAELARKHRYIPLTVRDEPGGRVLFLGMQDPGDVEALDNVSFRIGWKVKPILVAPSELEEALERYYPPEEPEPADPMLDLDPPEEPVSPVESESQEEADLPAAWIQLEDSEEPEPMGEPEFLLLEEVVQPPASIPQSPLEFVTDSDQPISETARSKLTQLVMALVEEGILERDELIERLRSGPGESQTS
jgi:type IV pilus assembly protein PilB